MHFSYGALPLKYFSAFLIGLFLGGCDFKEKKALRLGPNVEVSKVVLYYSDGDSDGKTVGEWVLVETGEMLKVRRNVIRPDSALIVHDWNKEFLPHLKETPKKGAVEIKFDRSNGVACVQGKCAELYAICPPLQTLNKSNPCKTYEFE